MKPDEMFQLIIEAIRRWSFAELRINTKEHWTNLEDIVTQLMEFEKSLSDVA